MIYSGKMLMIKRMASNAIDIPAILFKGGDIYITVSCYDQNKGRY